jgi:glyceraldehyde 3-phosphate dehydrogenase
MSTRIAINGFGRIGRLAFRQLMDEEAFAVAALNDIAPLDNLAYLLRHDSVQAEPDVAAQAVGDALQWADAQVPFLSERDPAALPWGDMAVDIVIEASGVFTKKEEAAKHLDAGAACVIITAPAKGEVPTICMGVNEEIFEPGEHKVVSNASCTTNCLAPVAKVLHDSFGIVTGFLTTVHAVTSSQTVVDAPHKKWRRGRAAIASIVPTTTGAAIATTKVLPQLRGRLDGLAMRVPVPCGSVIDFVVQAERPLDAGKVNDAFRTVAQTDRLKGILGVSDDEVVSDDIIGSPLSALVDAPSTMVVGDHTAKVLAFYDNEWGYARRVVDLAAYVAERI